MAQHNTKEKQLPLRKDGMGLSIVKIGGNIIEDKVKLAEFLSLFSKMKGPKILVHGGGKKANQVLKKMGLTPKIVDGRRITDAESLDVAIMVYGGLANKNIVAQLQSMGCNAIGMSGADANSIKAIKRPVKDIDYGFAGDVTGVSNQNISAILSIGLTPVFCALTHDQEGQLLNTNADTIASEIAIGMSANFETTLFYCFELNGVLRNFEDKNSVIPRIDTDSYENLISEGVIADGMLPKMHNCFHALNHGVKEVRIGHLGLFDEKNTNYTTLVL